jgi:hypothetical protein
MSYVFKPILGFSLALAVLAAACSAKVVPPIQPVSQALTKQDPPASPPAALMAADADFVAAMLAP